VAFADIAHSALLSFKFQQTLDAELWQFGVKTEKRGTFDVPDLVDAVHTWITSGDVIMERNKLVGITYSEWETSGFTGYHQVFSQIYSDSFSSGNQLPPQCAAVASLLNTSEVGVSVKSRRGRIYFGQIPVSFVDGDGLLTTTARDGYRSALDSLQTALTSVASGSPDDISLDGICIASPATSSIYDATVAGVGLAVDTQRRRRRKRVESISYTSL